MEIKRELIDFYEIKFEENEPDWGQKWFDDTKKAIPPTIPFIGKNYDMNKVLIYASAENLVNGGEHLYDCRNQGQIYNRHEYAFKTQNNNLDSMDYPQIWCQPIKDGGLLLAVAYLCKKLKLDIDYGSPIRFINSVAACNFGKYSISGNKNSDYADKLPYLKYSFKYVEKDLQILKPDYLFIPKTIYQFAAVRRLINTYVPDERVFSFYQMNCTAININIVGKYSSVSLDDLDLCKWIDGLDSKIKNNFSCVLTYLDTLFAQRFC